MALFTRLGRTAAAQTARRFLDAAWDGHFVVALLPDGVTLNRAVSGLDSEIVADCCRPDAPADWRRALDWVEEHHGVPGGFDFNDDRDGLWVEGTAQAALVWRLVGRDPQPLLATLAGQIGPTGYLWATREPVVTTGLALSPHSTTTDFVYRRRPHLGATAWAILAAKGWNLYAGKSLR